MASTEVIKVKEWVIKSLEESEFSEELVKEFCNTYFEKQSSSKAKAITEAGIKIITGMQKNFDEPATAKKIAEAVGISSRAIAGSMRKLIADGYCDKDTNLDTNVYFLTEKGKSFSIEK